MFDIVCIRATFGRHQSIICKRIKTWERILYIKRNISLKIIFKHSWPIFALAVLWTFVVFAFYHYDSTIFKGMPFQPITVVGIAVTFLIGFKNNQSYDRFWEARKIWGGIVNYSRTWTAQVLSLPSPTEDFPSDELRKAQETMIYRHMAWLHALKNQLRRPTPFSPQVNALARRLLNKHIPKEDLKGDLAPYLSTEELKDILSRRNPATHINKNQAFDVKMLKNKGCIDSLDHQMLMGCIEENYNLQGKCERIKNTPFPRQYAFFSKVFNYIFVALVPFGLVHIFNTESILEGGNLPYYYLSFFAPISVLTIWMFLTWEHIGDTTEDPFENKINDVPISALTRTIEIDLRDALDESALPAKYQPKDNILY